MEVNDGHQTPNQMDLGESWHSWSQSCKMQSLETLKLRGWDKNKSRVLGSSRRLYDWTWCRSPRSKTEQTLTATLESKQQSCWYQTEVLARFPPLPSLTAAQQTTRGFLPNQTASLPSSIRKTHTRALEDNRIPPLRHLGDVTAVESHKTQAVEPHCVFHDFKNVNEWQQRRVQDAVWTPQARSWVETESKKTKEQRWLLNTWCGPPQK